MGLSEHAKSSKTPLYETHIYRKLANWFKNFEEISELKVLIKNTRGDYQRLLIQELLRKDFLRIFTIMCELACQCAVREESYQSDIPEEDKLINIVEDVIGYVIGDLIFETTDIPILNEILKDLKKTKSYDFKRWINDRANGKVWITEPIDQIIEDVVKKNLKEADIEEIPDDWQITYEEAAKYDFALFCRIALTEVESMLAACDCSKTFLHNILYGLITLRLLMGAFKDEKDNLYVTWLADEDLFTGASGVNRFFDGIVILEEEDRDHPWLLKCISTYYNPLEAIESIDAKLDDIGMNRCILFIPMYPSRNASRYSVYTYAEKHHEILILYRHDLYRMIGMEGSEIKEYLRNKRI